MWNYSNQEMKEAVSLILKIKSVDHLQAEVNCKGLGHWVD